MDRLYAPWRSEYLMSDHSPGETCLFCGLVGDGDDRANFVLERGQGWYTIINRYPYTTGHVMVVCNRHVGEFFDLTGEESSEMVEMISRAERALRTEYAPDGINVGANLGRSAGAGIVGHLHIHLVPRWHGDTNFMASIADTRVVSENMNDTYERVQRALRALTD